MLYFVSCQSPSLVCQSKNFQRPTNRRAIMAGAVLAKFNLRGPHALDPPRSAVASKPSLQQPTQPSLEGNNNIHTWPTLPTPLSSPCRRPKPRALLLPGLALSRVIVSPRLKYSGKTGCSAERAPVLTLPAYSRLFPRGKRTLQQLPLFTRAREP